MKEGGCGRILLPNATGLQAGDEASPMERGTRTVVPCTRAGMENGTMQAVIRNIPSFVKLVLLLLICALIVSDHSGHRYQEGSCAAVVVLGYQLREGTLRGLLRYIPP